MQMYKPSHPGRLLKNFMGSRNIAKVAKHLGVSRQTLSRVLNGKGGVTADFALRISEAFNTEPLFWLRLQAQSDLWVASRKRRKKIGPLKDTDSGE